MAVNWQIGDRIQNRWEIHKIFKGGMGIVYVVYDHEDQAVYAAKTFQDQVFGRASAIADRFQQEALIWINLDIHQNITKAHYFRHIEEKPYLFLEYVSGGALSRWIGTPNLTQDFPRVLQFAIQFCDGMSHVFGKGITAHRDIKPQNCLITLDYILKVTDFGLAKALDYTEFVGREEVRRLNMGLTCTGKAAGTCTHMAPEQFSDSKHVDMRADIYSFGVLLYQMVTGTLPFMGRTWTEYEFLHKRQSWMPFTGQHAILNGIIARCLAKEADERYDDFGRIRDELVKVYEEWTGMQAPEAANGASLGALEFTNKGASLAELGRHEAAVECYDRALELNPNDARAWFNKSTAFGLMGQHEKALALSDRALEIDPRLAQAWNNKGHALLRLGHPEEAIAFYERALKLDPGLVEVWFNKGAALQVTGIHEQAIECYDRALKINQRFELAWYNKGCALSALGRVPEAIKCYDRALQLNQCNVDAWSGKASAMHKLSKYVEALDCYNHALQIQPNSRFIWFNKGALLHSCRQFPAAFICFEEAQRLGHTQAAEAIALCQKELTKKT